MLTRGCVTLSLPDQFPAVDVFWQGDLIGPSSGRLRAVVASEYREISQADLLQELARQPDLAAWILQQQQQRIDVLRDRILWLRRPVEHRLVRTLMALDLQAKDRMPEASGIIPLTQRELAGLAGATRENTSTSLNRWSTQGLVELQRRRLRILSHKRLIEVINQSPQPAPTGAAGAAA